MMLEYMRPLSLQAFAFLIWALSLGAAQADSIIFFLLVLFLEESAYLRCIDRSAGRL